MNQAESKSLSRPMRSSRWKYETSITSLAISNPKVFFAHVRRNGQLSHQITSLKTDLGVIDKELKAHAKLLNKFHDAVYRTDAGQPIPRLPISSVMMGTPCLVHKEHSTLNTSKSPGPDQLHPQLLKWLATFLADPLACLFNNIPLLQPSCRITARRL